jgi:predicted DNA-binding transcriptional regulator AlpA
VWTFKQWRPTLAITNSTPNNAAILAAFDTLPSAAFVKRPIVQALWGGICDFEVDRLEKLGKLPRRIKLGTRVNGWQVGALRSALAALQASSSAA